MNIIIPLGGKGERFAKEGYLQPKPLIQILNKEMIFYVLDNLKFTIKYSSFIFQSWINIILPIYLVKNILKLRLFRCLIKQPVQLKLCMLV